MERVRLQKHQTQMWWNQTDFVSVWHVTSSNCVCEQRCCMSAWDWSMLQWEGVSDSVSVVMRVAACASAVSEYWMRHRGLTLMTLLDAESCADSKSADILHSPQTYSVSKKKLNKRLPKTCYGACHKMHMSAVKVSVLHEAASYRTFSWWVISTGCRGAVWGVFWVQDCRTTQTWAEAKDRSHTSGRSLALSHSKPLETCRRPMFHSTNRERKKETS